MQFKLDYLPKYYQIQFIIKKENIPQLNELTHNLWYVTVKLENFPFI